MDNEREDIGGGQSVEIDHEQTPSETIGGHVESETGTNEIDSGPASGDSLTGQRPVR